MADAQFQQMRVIPQVDWWGVPFGSSQAAEGTGCVRWARWKRVFFWLGLVTSGSAAWYESPAAAQLLDPPQKNSGREDRAGVGVSLWVAAPSCVGLDTVANTPS